MAKPYSPNASYSAEAYADCADAKLKFVYMSADVSLNPGLTEGVSKILFEANFLAFVTEFSEQFSSAWDSEQFYGKSEPIVGFKNTKRMLNLSWQVPASNAEEAKSNLLEIDNLTQMLYPVYSESLQTYRDITKKSSQSEFDKRFIKEYGTATIKGEVKTTGQQRQRLYNDENTYFRNTATAEFQPHGVIVTKPPLIGLQWSNIIKNRDALPFTGGTKLLSKNKKNDLLLGFLENLSFSVALDAGFFTENKQLYPKAYNLSCNFSVQHTHQLGRNEPLW